MVNVRGLVRLAAVAVALCAVSASARDAPTTAGVRGLQTADDTTTAPESPSPVTVVPPSDPSTTPPASSSPPPVVTEPVSPSPVTPTPSTTEPATTTPAPTSTQPATTTPAPTSTEPVTTTPAPTTTEPVTTTPAPTTTEPVTTTPAPTTTEPVTTTPAPTTTEPVTTTPVPPVTDPVTTTPVPPVTDPVTTTPVPPVTDPVTTTPVPPVTDPVTTTPVPPVTDPVTTTPAPPVTDPVTTTPVPPVTDPVTTTPVPPVTDPVTTTPVPPVTDPVTTTPVPPVTDPVTTTPVPPVTDPVTTTPVPPVTDPVTTTPVPTTGEPNPTSGPPPTTAPPPLVDVIVATERVETPSPSTTRSADPTSEPEVNSQANKKDIITANSTDETEAPKVNPFEIRIIESESPKPVVLDINDERTTTEEPKLYVRGDTTTRPPSSAGSAGSSNNDAPASSPNVIGGSRRNTGATTGSVLSTSSQNFHDFLRYAAAAFSGISVALLLFFHFVSLDATLTWTSSLWSPNTWEFILYVGYLQQMASVSQLTLLKTPYYLWDYADSFAWTNFLIQRPTSSEGRRLETIVLGGVVAYADRIGIDESKIVYHAVIGFAVVLAVLLVLFLIIAMFAKRKAEQALDDPLNLHHSTQSVHALRSASIRTLGLCVLIWYFALYPLSLFASFEISMEVQAKSAVASALLVSILAIGVVCFGVLAWSGRVIMQKSKEELLQFENMATWGSLYAEFSFRSRMFFILGALVQIVTGIIVGTMDSDPTQLIIVIIIEVLYLVAVFVLSPFAEMLVLRFTYALGILKIINYSLAFAFLNSNGMSGSGRNSVANAFIGINTIVIIAWFIRQLIVFSTYIRAWSVRTSFIEETQNAQEDGTAKYETRTATDSDVYASVSTARHGEGGPSVDTDDYHQAPAPREIHY